MRLYEIANYIGLMITPEGEVLDVEDWSLAHASTVVDYLEQNDHKTFEELKGWLQMNYGNHINPTTAGEFQIMDFALEKGWIRILDVQGNTTEFNANFKKGKPSDKAMLAARRLLSRSKADLYIVNNSQTRNEREAVQLLMKK